MDIETFHRASRTTRRRRRRRTPRSTGSRHPPMPLNSVRERKSAISGIVSGLPAGVALLALLSLGLAAIVGGSPFAFSFFPPMLIFLFLVFAFQLPCPFP